MANPTYWIGADGNAYYGSGQTGAGVQKFTNPQNVSAAGFQGTSAGGSFADYQAKQMNDPNAPAPTGPPNPNNITNKTATNTGPIAADKSGDIALQNAGLASSGATTAKGLAGVDTALTSVKNGYATEAANNETSYKTNSDQNQNNLQKNKGAALINAAQGRRGLFGTLASLGALNGDGIDLANSAVQTGANQDLSGAADNFATNQFGQDDAIKKFRDANVIRNTAADTEAGNEKQNIRNQGLKDKQTYFKNLADDYTAQLDPGQAANYANQAGALFPQISDTTVPATSLAPTVAAYTPGSLASYLSRADGTQVSSTSGNGGVGTAGLPGLVALNKKK